MTVGGPPYSTLRAPKRRRHRSRQRMLKRDRLYTAVSFSITVVIACSTVLKDGPIPATALIPNKKVPFGRQFYSQIEQSRSSNRQRNVLSASKKQPTQPEDENSWSFFFSSKSKIDESSKLERSEDETSKSSSIPFVGRFFSTDEEKAEKEQKKRRKKEEKEKIKNEKERRKKAERELKQKKKDPKDTIVERKRSKIIPSIQNYLQERQSRKEIEAMQTQTKLNEEERKRQMEQDAEELRAEVRRLEDERKRRKIEAQKEMEKKRKARLVEKAKEANDAESVKKISITKKKSGKTKAQDGLGEGKEEKTSSSKSQRFVNVVDAAQRLVSGVFEQQKEEWIVVAPKTRISPGEIVPVTAGGIDLLLVASKDGSAVHCVANSCPHLGTPLEVGSLERLPIESSSSSEASTDVKPVFKEASFFRENDIANMLKEDGCEDCIVCPLHKTAFALESGEVRGEWCPYPPVIGKLTGTVKKQSNLPVFDVRTKGKNIEVRLNTPVEINERTNE